MSFPFFSPLKRAAAPVALFTVLLVGGCGSPPATPAPGSANTAAASASGQAAGARAAPLASSPPFRPARSSEVHVDHTETFYDVTGHSAHTLLRDLTRRGPRIGSRRHFGRTSWTAHWRIEYQEPAGGRADSAPCRIRRTDVHLDVEVTLPRWDAPARAPTPLRRDWKSFIDALAFHEREHKESIISAGHRVMRTLDSLQAPSCPALKKKAETRARTIIERARRYNRRYDKRTDHGKTQGARWPPE